MKSIQITAALAAISAVAAYPSIALEAAAIKARESSEFQEAAREAHAKRLNGVLPGFDADAQRIDVSGEHAFQAPNFDAGDQRGPCPGLNALANHNYLPHNGIATIDEFVTATNEVFGMGLDLGTFLAVYGTISDGNPLSLTPGWSIGGATSDPSNQNILGNLLGVLGQPQGISNSHNKYETDSSPTRGDLFQYGDGFRLRVDQFESLFALQPDAETANYDLSVMAKERKISFERSVANNPYFFYGPFTGIAVSQAAHTFIYRFMSNKSAENPEGVLNQDVLKSFFSITGEPGSFVHTAGHEQIPENWYKRAIGDEYTISFLEQDILYFASEFPNTLSIGGNTGTVNSFTGVEPGDLTGGVFNATTLLYGNNIACFTMQVAQIAALDVLGSIVGAATDLVDAAVGQLNDAVNNALQPFTCPELKSITREQMEMFPGYMKSPGGLRV